MQQGCNTAEAELLVQGHIPVAIDWVLRVGERIQEGTVVKVPLAHIPEEAAGTAPHYDNQVGAGTLVAAEE